MTEPARATIPSVLVISIPKSGTIYMNQFLRQSLGLQNYVLSNQFFPDDQMRLEALPEFQSGGYMTSAHIDPSPMNLQLLDAFIPKWIVHFRDPRSVLLSWVHHVERLASEERDVELFRVLPVPPQALHGWTFERRIDWHIENFFPAVIDWMQRWVDVSAEMSDRILVTEYAELRRDDDAYARTVMDFLGIPSAAYSHAAPEKTMGSHFRTGRQDEWRDVLTSPQLDAVNRAIPAKLAERFAWPVE